MGLVMAQLIVQAYGGKIEGHKQEGGGTVMTIYLPVEKPEGS
jgi:signal transduction histidine kinase